MNRLSRKPRLCCAGVAVVIADGHAVIALVAVPIACKDVDVCAVGITAATIADSAVVNMSLQEQAQGGWEFGEPFL